MIEPSFLTFNLMGWFLFAPNCWRISPPLVIEDREIEKACEVVVKAIN